MPTRSLLAIVAVIAFTLAQHPLTGKVAAQAKNPPAKKAKQFDEPTLSALSMEIAALRTIRRFRLTTDQLSELGKLSRESAQKLDKREPAKASDKVRKRLLDLRDALVDGDDERSSELESKLATLLDDEGAELNDRIKITATAIRKLPDFMRNVTPIQIVNFLSDSEDDLPNPFVTLTDVLDLVTELKDSEWKELSEEIIGDVKWQLGGLDPERSRAVGDKVTDYLKKVRATKEEELKKKKKKRDDLEEAADEIVGQTTSMQLLQNFVEHSLAELLSNPQLPAALKALSENEDARKGKSKKGK